MIHAPQKLVVSDVIVDRREERSVRRDELAITDIQAVVVGDRATADLLRGRRGELSQEPIGDAVRRDTIDVVAQLRRFDLERGRATSGVARAFVAAEKEGFILDDRPTHIAAELMEDKWRIRRRKKVARVERR